MIKLIKDKFLNKRFLSFGFIGLFNTALSLLFYNLFIILNVSVALSSLLGDGGSMIFSYFLNMKFTYNQKPTLKTFISFPLSYIPGIIVNMIITVLFVDVFGSPEEYAKLFSIPITVPLNFLVMSLIVKKASKE